MDRGAGSMLNSSRRPTSHGRLLQLALQNRHSLRQLAVQPLPELWQATAQVAYDRPHQEKARRLHWATIRKEKGLINQSDGSWHANCLSGSAKQMILSGAAHRKV